MNKRVVRTIAALVLTAGCVSMSVWAAGERPEIGGVMKVQRDATATYDTDSRKLATEEPVFFQDMLKTAPQARLAVMLDDGTKLTLGEGAALRIDKFVYQPKKDVGSLVVSVLTGAFLFQGGTMEDMRNSQISIQTPVATLGVRGTTVWGGRIDGAFGILVRKGRVTVHNAAGEVTLGAGEGTMIDTADSPPSAPKTWPEEKVQRALRTVRFQSN